MIALAVVAVVAAAAPIRIVSADGAPVSLELVRSAATQAAAVAGPTASSMPNLYEVPARCRNLTYRVVDSEGRPVA